MSDPQGAGRLLVACLAVVASARVRRPSGQADPLVRAVNSAAVRAGAEAALLALLPEGEDPDFPASSVSLVAAWRIAEPPASPHEPERMAALCRMQW